MLVIFSVSWVENGGEKRRTKRVVLMYVLEAAQRLFRKGSFSAEASGGSSFACRSDAACSHFLLSSTSHLHLLTNENSTGR